MRVLQLSFAIASISSVCSATPTPKFKPGPYDVDFNTDQKICGYYRTGSIQRVLPLFGGGWFNAKDNSFMNSVHMEDCILCVVYR